MLGENNQYAPERPNMPRTRKTEDLPTSSLDAALLAIAKAHGPEALIRLGDRPLTQIPTIPTGILPLDIALGVGGLPKGRIIEIFGPESSGKTTVALSVIAEAQRRGAICAFIDVEHALDVNYAKSLGVNTDDLLFSQPSSGEQAMDILAKLTTTGAVGVIVIDSVAALAPQAEIDGETGDPHVALQARLVSQTLRRITPTLSKTGQTVLFLNQLRSKIGSFYGSTEDTPGGRALKFYSSVRLDLRRIKTIRDGDRSVGIEVRAKVVKNKVAPPFTEAKYEIRFGLGVDRYANLLALALEAGLVRRAGAWYATTDGEQLGQGSALAADTLRSRPDLTEELERQVRQALSPMAPTKPNVTDLDPPVLEWASEALLVEPEAPDFDLEAQVLTQIAAGVSTLDGLCQAIGAELHEIKDVLFRLSMTGAIRTQAVEDGLRYELANAQ